jgi:hypothetical protein
MQMVFLLLFFSVTVDCTGNPEIRNERMDSNDTAEMNIDDDANTLSEKALLLAGSADPADMNSLAQLLSDDDFLSKLDSDEDYQSSPHTLRVTGVLERLSNNSAPEAHTVLSNLTKSPVFGQRISRTEVLIVTCAKIRPPSQDVLQFWDAHAQGGSSKPLVVGALFENNTPESMVLFEKLMLDSMHGDDEKIFWLKNYAVPHRDNLPFLQASERLLTRPIDSNMKIELIRVIFDYREDWYPPRDMPKPPDPMLIDPDARDVLQTLGEYALSLDELPENLGAAVKKRLSAYGEATD